MPTNLDFQEILELYIKKFGHTFTTFGLFPESMGFEIAYIQMIQCLDGERTDPVTNDSIGRQGEGVYFDNPEA